MHHSCFRRQQLSLLIKLLRSLLSIKTTHQNALHTNNGNVSDAFDAESGALMTPPIADAATIAN
jgi:hypothetical protein